MKVVLAQQLWPRIIDGVSDKGLPSSSHKFLEKNIL